MSLIFLYFSLQNCTSEVCNGDVLVENPISDIILSLEEKQEINLSNPAVFIHTQNETLGFFSEVLESPEILDTNIISKEISGEVEKILVLNPRAQGKALVVVSAGAGCRDATTDLYFTVTIKK